MYSLYNQHLAEEHMQTLRREAAAMRALNNNPGMQQAKTGLPRFWYVVLGLTMPEYGVSSSKLNQALAYDWWQQRTKMLLRVIGWIAFALGILIGSMLSSSGGLLLPLLLAALVTLVVSVPMAIRLLAVVRGQRMSRMVHAHR